ncbi:MAG: nitrous oxide-stimulated promoter family protein [Actinomycetota bacterium]|nr:MAG: hypothetical protein FD171_213 [Actinomycetota bacterium]MDP3630263.1 nitrous oxide-stimulated promoter family protein [Actinomycetota bacterium]
MGGTAMNERFRERMSDAHVRADTRTVGDFVGIYCEGNHADRVRAALQSDAATLGVYTRKTPVLCDECAEHLRYAEKRRAYCARDPKPFCAHCDTQCYKPDKLAWQRTMMRYSGPRSVWHGYAIAGIKHALEALKYRKQHRDA